MVITPYNSSTDLWYMYFQNKTGDLTLIEIYGIYGEIYVTLIKKYKNRNTKLYAMLVGLPDNPSVDNPAVENPSVDNPSVAGQSVSGQSVREQIRDSYPYPNYRGQKFLFFRVGIIRKSKI
uniref:Uncharacterized protein n=1 Tax=Meloidogyne enterolobii TaxID=390850 RepID=A0A6V7TTD3_MELEN|nr:unnamed protein product [Meloidogyne enterolobii]